METPLNDERLYRIVTLSNSLEVLLVHDANTDKASAAMDVNVGNFSDNKGTPGMAHAVEHVSVMGTKKYENENDFAEYLSLHSGSFNANTDGTSTNYHFDVAPSEDVFYGALDRFAQFFICPLFNNSTLHRELKVIDSEHQKNLAKDHERALQVRKFRSNPNHPWSYFETGTFDSLKTAPEARGLNVREFIMSFHEQNYSANRMKLVILGNQSLDMLEEWAALFTDIPNKNLPQHHWETEVPLRPEDLLTQCFVRSIGDWKWIDIEWPFLDETLLLGSQPSGYICHLIDHRGLGSIFSILHSKGWVVEVNTTMYSVCPGTPGILSCRIHMTDNGLRHYRELLKEFLDYCGIIGKTPPQEWIFNELKAIEQLNFTYKENGKSRMFTKQVSAVMKMPIPRELLLSGKSRLTKFDTALIEEGLACIRPDNFRFTLVSQTFPGMWNQKEQWYGTEYKYEKIPADFLAELERASIKSLPEFHLPRPNLFIPKNLVLKEGGLATEPKLLQNNDAIRAWYMPDFKVPKANVFIHCKSAFLSNTAKGSTIAKLYFGMVEESLREILYDAGLAGLRYKLEEQSAGFLIKISGYDENISILLKKVLTAITDLEIQPDRLGVVKQRLSRLFKNTTRMEPWHQAFWFMTWLNGEKQYGYEQTAVELQHLVAADVKEFRSNLLGQLQIETFIHGNMYKGEALRLNDMVKSSFQPKALPQTQWPVARSLCYKSGSNFVYHRILPISNHCIKYSMYLGDRFDIPLRAKTFLLHQMIFEPAFDQLRTKKQLGYIVHSRIYENDITISYNITIQSNNTPKDLESSIESFLTRFGKVVTMMSKSTFEEYRESAIAVQLEEPKSLNEKSSYLWSYIIGGYLDFELKRHDAAQLKELTQADFIEFYERLILPSSLTRCKLCIHLQANENAKTEAVSGVEKCIKSIGPDERNGDHGGVEDTSEGNGTTLSNILDVMEFKSRMMFKGAAQPVKDYREFADLDANSEIAS